VNLGNNFRLRLDQITYGLAANRSYKLGASGEQALIASLSSRNVRRLQAADHLDCLALAYNRSQLTCSTANGDLARSIWRSVCSVRRAHTHTHTRAREQKLPIRRLSRLRRKQTAARLRSRRRRLSSHCRDCLSCPDGSPRPSGMICAVRQTLPGVLKVLEQARTRRNLDKLCFLSLSGYHVSELNNGAIMSLRDR
jgi:hypothetical protein